MWMPLKAINWVCVFFPRLFCVFVARFYLPGEVQHSAPASGTLQSQPEKVQYLKSFDGQSGMTHLQQNKNKAAGVDIGKQIWQQAKLA